MHKNLPPAWIIVQISEINDKLEEELHMIQKRAPMVRHAAFTASCSLELNSPRQTTRSPAVDSPDLRGTPWFTEVKERCKKLAETLVAETVSKLKDTLVRPG